METATPTTMALVPHHQGRWYQHLYVQVMAVILAGVLLRHFCPPLGEAMKPLEDAVIKMISRSGSEPPADSFTQTDHRRRSAFIVAVVS